VEIAYWIGNINLHPDAWAASDSVSDWWPAMDHTICVAKQRAEISQNFGVQGSLEGKKCEDLRVYRNAKSSPLAKKQR